MYALKTDKIASKGEGNRTRKSAWLVRRVRSVLPRMIDVGGAMPRRSGSLLLSGFFASVFLFGVVAGGHGKAALEAVTSSFGLAVEKVDITGLVQTSEIDVLEAIGLDADSALPALDVAGAYGKIMALPWVKSVSLRKIYPNRLQVEVTERQALGVWQHQGRLDIIDRDGELIVPFAVQFGRDLPLLVGRGAAGHGAEILTIVEKIAAFKSRVRAYVRVADRRWDIVLDNGIEIKLPAQDFEKRLQQLLEIDANHALFSRDVRVIDLRLEGQMNVTLSDEGMAQWRQHAGVGRKG